MSEATQTEESFTDLSVQNHKQLGKSSVAQDLRAKTTKYFFPAEQDTNHAGRLSKALSTINLNNPSTFGGVVRKAPANGYSKFNTFSPPDLTSSTRIVAVCGIWQKDAMPQGDGWFLSDFFAL